MIRTMTINGKLYLKTALGEFELTGANIDRCEIYTGQGWNIKTWYVGREEAEAAQKVLASHSS